MRVFRPSPDHSQPCQGHIRSSPTTVPFTPRCAPRCRQNASCTYTWPAWPRQSTNFSLKYSNGITWPGVTSWLNATGNQPSGDREVGNLAVIRCPSRSEGMHQLLTGTAVGEGSTG